MTKQRTHFELNDLGRRLKSKATDSSLFYPAGRRHPIYIGPASAFTRLELCFVVVALAMIVLCVYPLLAGQQTRSELVQCRGNLRQIGQAFHEWSTESLRRERPWWTYQSRGGSRIDSGLPKPGVAWVEFFHVSPQLPAPQVLVCPSDVSRRQNWARNWSFDSDQAFPHQNYRNNALSYFIGLHARFDDPSSILSGDRHLTPNLGSTNCLTGINNALGLDPAASGEEPVTWGNLLHGSTGNLLENSGAVLTASSGELPSVLTPASTNFPVLHLLMP